MFVFRDIFMFSGKSYSVESTMLWSSDNGLCVTLFLSITWFCETIKAIVVKLVSDGSLVATPASCRVKTLPLLLTTHAELHKLVPVQFWLGFIRPNNLT